jgi:hypothetical protein
MANHELLYLTRDEVNFATVSRWAEPFSLGVQEGFLKDPLQDERWAGLLIDLDAWDRTEWDRLFMVLAHLSASCPTAVHSYSLNEDHAAALKYHGVLVFRRLEPKILLLLTQANSVMGGAA